MSSGGFPPPPGPGDDRGWGQPPGSSPAAGEPPRTGWGQTGWGQPGPESGYPGQGGYGGPPAPGNGQAVAAMVCGIVSLVCLMLFFLVITVPIALGTAIAAVVTGIIGLRISRERGGVGRGQAIAGLVTGGVTLGLAAIGFVMVLVFFSWFEAEFETNPFQDPEGFMTELEEFDQRQREQRDLEEGVER